MTDALMDNLKETKEKYSGQLMQKANVVGVGVGYKEIDGLQTDALCIRVYVRKKVAANSLKPEDQIPELLDGFRTDVIFSGELTAQ